MNSFEKILKSVRTAKYTESKNALLWEMIEKTLLCHKSTYKELIVDSGKKPKVKKPMVKKPKEVISSITQTPIIEVVKVVKPAVKPIVKQSQQPIETKREQTPMVNKVEEIFNSSTVEVIKPIEEVKTVEVVKPAEVIKPAQTQPAAPANAMLSQILEPLKFDVVDDLEEDAYSAWGKEINQVDIE